MSDLDLPDVNVLTALTHPHHVHHEQAHRWLASAERFVTTSITESGLLRMLLNPNVGGAAVAAPEACRVLAALKAHPKATFIADDASLATPVIDISGLTGFKQVTDLHLVNLAAQHAARLVTFDRRLTSVLVDSDQRFAHALG